MKFYNIITISFVIILLYFMLFPMSAVSQSNTETVKGQPDIEVNISDNKVTPDEKNSVIINISNEKNITDGGLDKFESNVSTIKNISVDLKTERSISIVSRGDQIDNSIEPDESESISVELFVPEDASDQNLNVDISYNHTKNITYNTTTNNVINSKKDSKTKIESFDLETKDIAIFDVETGSNQVSVGETGYNDIDVTNNGDFDVKDAEIELQFESSEATFEGSKRETINLDDIETSETETVETKVTFSESASDSQYTADGTITYENQYGEEGSYEVEDIKFNPREETDVSVEETDTNAPIGGSGVFEIELENQGQTDMHNVNFKLKTQSNIITLGGNSAQATFSLDDWDSGDEKTIESPISFSGDASKTEYSLSGTVIYENEDDIQNRESIDSINVEPLEKQEINSEILESDIVEGENSDIVFKIENKGPKDAENIKVTFDGDEYLIFLKNSKNIAKLEAGESESFSIPIESPEGVKSKSQNIDVSINYKDTDNGDKFTESDIYSVNIQENNQKFNVDVFGNNTVKSGGSETIRINIENNKSSKITDIESELSTSDPLSLQQESVYIDSLESGEEEKINVTVSASSGSLVNTYQMKVDFSYEDKSGNAKLSEVYSVPIDVEKPDEEGSSPIVLYVLIIMVPIFVSVYYRKKIISRINSIERLNYEI